jgi:hypothetical protein
MAVKPREIWFVAVPDFPIIGPNRVAYEPEGLRLRLLPEDLGVVISKIKAVTDLSHNKTGRTASDQQ